MQNFKQEEFWKHFSPSTHQKGEVPPKLTSVRSGKIFSIVVNAHWLLFVLIVACMNSAQGQQYKFKWCENYHTISSEGITIREDVAFGDSGRDSIFLTVKGDSIMFNVPALSISDRTRFQIKAREEYQDDHGNKVIKFTIDAPVNGLKIDRQDTTLVIKDSPPEIDINIVISGHHLSAYFEN